VPAYRHPDPLLYPVFCDYGESRWAISFEAHKPRKSKKGVVDVHGLKMGVWNGKEDEKKIVNLWRDPSCKFSKTGWKYYAEYWDDAEVRVMDLIKKLSQQVVW